eukprot:3621633-Pyramimonas_sp.AAC.1
MSWLRGWVSEPPNAAQKGLHMWLRGDLADAPDPGPPSSTSRVALQSGCSSKGAMPTCVGM